MRETLGEGYGVGAVGDGVGAGAVECEGRGESGDVYLLGVGARIDEDALR